MLISQTSEEVLKCVMFSNLLFQNAIYKILLWLLLTVVFFKNYVGLDQKVEQNDGKLKAIKKTNRQKTKKQEKS